MDATEHITVIFQQIKSSQLFFGLAGKNADSQSYQKSQETTENLWWVIKSAVRM